MTTRTPTRPTSRKATYPGLWKNFDPTVEAVEIRLLTKEHAKALLDLNTNNRPPRPQYVRQYTNDMDGVDGGRWYLLSTGIGVAWDGTITNGQNRLLALEQAEDGTMVKIAVFTGLDPASRMFEDGGAPRNLADALHFRGVPQATNISQIITHVWKASFIEWRPSGRRLSIGASLARYDSAVIEWTDPQTKEPRSGNLYHLAINQAWRLYSQPMDDGGKLRGSLGGYAVAYWLMADKWGKDVADEMFQNIIWALANSTIETVPKAIIALGNSLIGAHTKVMPIKGGVKSYCALILKCCDMAEHGLSLNIAKWRGENDPKEPMPVLGDLRRRRN